MNKLLLFVGALFLCASGKSQVTPLCGGYTSYYQNTTNVPSIGELNCLGSVPNPTIFSIGIVEAELSLEILIEQFSGYNQMGAPISPQLDVDFICFGPFDHPIANIEEAIEGSVVSCSYASSNYEQCTIPNPVPGEFYTLIVTNFSNQPGIIKISPLSQLLCDFTRFRLDAFLDSNGNGLREDGEVSFPFGNFSYSSTTYGTDNFISSEGQPWIWAPYPDDLFDFDFTIFDSHSDLYTVTTPSYTDVPIIGFTTDILFAVQPITPFTDLGVSIVPLNDPMPGFTYHQKIIVTNYGTQPSSGTLHFEKDAALPQPLVTDEAAQFTPDGFTLDFATIPPFGRFETTVDFAVPVIPTVELGQMLASSVSITNLEDVLESNNVFSMQEEIVGSYDPNDKAEAHGGRILIDEFTADDQLVYTIRFENEGTASATRVVIEDLLDERLDETTFRTLSSSHEFRAQRSGSQIGWDFPGIVLPPSIEGTQIGHGYVQFSVKPKPGYAVGDIIPNQASIYFDYNPAILTPVCNTEFVTTMGLGEFFGKSFAVYPNPASYLLNISLKKGTVDKLVLRDVSGKAVLSEKGIGTNLQTLNVSSLESGTYLLEITTSEHEKHHTKVIIK